MRVAAPLVLRTGDREKPAKVASSRAGEAGRARRARMVLLAADGLPYTEVAPRCGTSVPTVRHWRSRYVAAGVKALEDLPRAGRPKTVDEVKVVVTTLEPPPGRLGVTHWSSRLLARELGVSTASIIEVWHKWDLQPWRRESFKFSADPQLEAKLTDVVGLYLHPRAPCGAADSSGGERPSPPSLSQ
jgi:transposase